MKKDLAIVLNVNKKYFFLAYTICLNIINFYKNFSNIIIFTYDLDESEKKYLQQIDMRILVTKYTYKMFSKEFHISHYPDAKNFIKRFTHLTIAKIKLYKLLNYYKKVVYFDCDLLIIDNIDTFFKYDKSFVAAKNEHNFFNLLFSEKRNSNHHLINKILNTKFPRISNILANVDTVNGGLIMLNDNFDFNKAYKLGIIVARYLMRYFPKWIDEIAFCIVNKLLNIDIGYVNRIEYNALPSQITNNTKIIHMYANQKPYGNPASICLFREWHKYYNTFLKNTNMPSSLVSDNIGKSFEFINRQATFQHYHDIYKQFIAGFILSLPDNIYYEFDLSKFYMCLYIRNVPHGIHYEICIKNDILIGLHCEGKSIKAEYENLFKTLAKRLSINSANIYKLEIKTSPAAIVDDFKHIYSQTIADIYQAFKIETVDNQQVRQSENINKTCQLQKDTIQQIALLQKTSNESLVFLKNLNIYAKYNNLAQNFNLTEGEAIKYIPIFYKDITTRFHIPFYYSDLIQRIILLSGNFWEIDLLEKFLDLLNVHNSKEGAFIDVGANIGNHTLFFHQYLRAKSIYSFEPQEIMFNILVKNCKINNINAKLYRNIVHSKAGHFKISKFSNSNFGATVFTSTEIDTPYKAITLDSLNIAEAVVAVKIDCEGNELSVLQGSENLLLQHHPFLWIEIKKENLQVVEYLKKYNYGVIFSRGEDYMFA